MITKLQEQIILAVNDLYKSGLEIGGIGFVNKMEKNLGRRLQDSDYKEIAEACLDLQRQGVFRSVEIGSADIIRNITPSYPGIAYKELKRLDKKERWKEKCIGALFTLAIWMIKEIAYLFIG